MQIIKKIPPFEQIAKVYAVIAVIFYSWSLVRFFWRLPSFIISSTVGEIGIFYSYLIVVNFLESLVILIIPIGLSIFLPSRWYYERFVTKSTLMLVLGLWYISYLADSVFLEIGDLYAILRNIPFVILLIILLMFLLDKIAFLRKIILDLTERLTVFLYIIIPVTVISLLIVLLRNSF